jgi:hypothetical protein
MDKVGVFRGRAKQRADGTWAQYGERENGNLELIVDVAIVFPEGTLVRSIPHYINEKTYEFVIERLRAHGWKGDDISNLAGLGDNEVDVEVTVEEYQGKTRNKYNILTGGGRFTVQTPVDPKMFAAKMAAISGGKAGGGATGAPPPPF